jgi:hypothetical protein
MIELRMKGSGWILVCYSVKQRTHLYRIETDSEVDLHRGLNECIARKADIIFIRRYEK